MRYKVQQCVALKGKSESGVRVGRVWKNVVVCRRQAVAERLAQYKRQDLRHERPVETRTAPVRIAT
jgi:hypothetical protein